MSRGKRRARRRGRHLLAAACLLAFVAFAAAPADAASIRPPVGGCLDDDATVQACQPVCVTTPCNPYVCVNTNLLDRYCVRP